MHASDRWHQAKQVTLLGAIVNALLGISKVTFGLLGNSHALIADGIHSFSDLLTDALVIFAARFGSIEADEDHPYGHQRIETAATIFLAMLLILAGSGIAWDSLSQLFVPAETKPSILIILVALSSIIANEALYHYTRYIGKKIDSALIIANAWHHRSDAASSIIVFIGLVATMLGFGHLDAVAAIIVGLMIIKMGVSLGWNSIKELVDTGVGPQQLTEITQAIEQVPGVIAIHQLRTRSMGGQVLIDVHVLVQEKISVSEGHHIAQNVHHNLVKKVDKIKDVTVHIDPEDDEVRCPSVQLPAREILLPQLMACWKDLPCVEQLKGIVIHYIDGKIELELKFIYLENDAREVATHYVEAVNHFPDIVHIHIENRVL